MQGAKSIWLPILTVTLIAGCSDAVKFTGQLGETAISDSNSDRITDVDEFERAQPPAQVAGVSLTFSCEELPGDSAEVVRYQCALLDGDGLRHAPDAIEAINLRDHEGVVHTLTFSSWDQQSVLVEIPRKLAAQAESLECDYSTVADGRSESGPVQTVAIRFDTLTPEAPTPAPTAAPTAAPVPEPAPAPEPVSCSSTPRVNKSFQVVFPARSSTCSWGTGDNAPAEDGKITARMTEAVTLPLETSEILCSLAANVDAPHFKYEDLAVVTLNQTILFSSAPLGTFLYSNGAEQTFDWTRLVNHDFPERQDWCHESASDCVIPADGENDSPILFSLPSIEASEPLLANANNGVEFALTLIGDNDSEDCTHHGLIMNIQYQVVGP